LVSRFVVSICLVLIGVFIYFNGDLLLGLLDKLNKL
jgi:hypothetical protein